MSEIKANRQEVILKSGSRVPEELAAMLERVRPRIKNILSKYRIPPEDGADVLQDACLAVLSTKENIENLEAWFFQTLENRCIIYWRKRNMGQGIIELMPEVSLLEAFPEVSKMPIDVLFETHAYLEKILPLLPPRGRRIFTLSYIYNLNSVEIAAKMKDTPGNIRKTLQRTRIKFLQVGLRLGLFDAETCQVAFKLADAELARERDRNRKQQQRKNAEKEADAKIHIASIIGRNDLPDDVQIVLATLNRKYRECLLRKFWLGENMAEIIKIVGCDIYTLYRATDKFLTTAGKLQVMTQELQEIIAKILLIKRPRRKG